jgi:hypothetical protein
MQPWATLVALGIKKIETRTWNTAWRGTIAIHASKHMDRHAQILHLHVHTEGLIPEFLPLGQLIAVATLTETYPTGLPPNDISELEKRFGNFCPGRFAWHLNNAFALPVQYSCTGHLGLWQIPDNLVPLITRQYQQFNPPLRT